MNLNKVIMPAMFLLLSCQFAEAGTDIKLHNGQLIHADKCEIDGNDITYTLPGRKEVYTATLDEVASISGEQIKYPLSHRRHRRGKQRRDDQLWIIPFRRFGIIQLEMTMNDVRSILGEPDDVERMEDRYGIYDFWDYGHTRFHFTNGILRNWVE